MRIFTKVSIVLQKAEGRKESKITVTYSLCRRICHRFNMRIFTKVSIVLQKAEGKKRK